MSWPTLTNVRLRVLSNTTGGDPATAQRQLEFKKSTDSVWRTVTNLPVSSPSIAQTATTDGTTTATTCAVNIPVTGLVAGDLFLVLFRSAGAATVSWPDAGWVELFEDATDAGSGPTALAWRKATGAETGSINVTTSVTGKFGALAWRITGAQDPTVQPPEFAALAIATTSTAPDPGTVTPTGGSKPYLFLAVMTSDGEATSPPGTFPTGYTLNPIAAQSGTGGAVTTNVRLAGGGRQATAANENPSAFAISAAPAGSTATTIAVHPAPLAAIQLATSGNIAASAATATTAQLAVPSGTGKTFVAGDISDDTNPLPTVDLPTEGYVEDEWCLQATATAVNGEVYQFRVTLAGTPLTTYSQTPSWTIGVALPTIQVGDAVTVADDETIKLVNPPILVGESITLADGRNVIIPVVAVVQIPNVGDLVTLSESPTIKGLTLPLSAADGITLADTSPVMIPAAGLLPIATGDAVTVADDETIKLVNPPILVGESITLSDSATPKLANLPLFVADAVTLTDGRTVIVPQAGVLQINRSDAITIADLPELELIRAIADAVTIDDSALANLLNQPHVGESVSLTDQGQTSIPAAATLSAAGAETITVAEGPVLRGVIPATLLTDLITLADSPTLVGLTNSLLTTETLTFTESASATITPLSLATAEAITLADNRFVTIPVVGLLPISNVGDLLTLTDSSILTISPLLALATDLLTLNELPGVRVTLGAMLVADALTLTDAPTLLGLTPAMSAVDNVTLTDQALIRPLIPSISVGDSVTLAETPLTKIAVLPLLVSESIAITDQGAAFFATITSQAESITIADTVVVRGLTLKSVGAELLTLSDQPRVFAGFRASDLVTVLDGVTVSTIGGIVTQPVLRATAEVRDLTKVMEIALASVTAELRNLLKTTELRQDTAIAEVRNLTKTIEILMASVTAEVRNLAKTA